MASLKQSFSWWCFSNRGVTPDALLSAGRAMGYEGVDLIPDELWPLAVKHGLRVVAVNGHDSITDGLNHRKNHARILAELRARIAQAERAGVAALVCFSGNRGALNDRDGMEACAEALRQVAPMAESAGVQLIVELLNSKVDHPDYQCDRSAFGVQLIDTVHSPAVRLLYDIYHMQVMEGDIVRTLREAHPKIGHYHTAGNPGRGPMDEDQELNYPALFRAIEKTGYTGYIAHEFVPRGEPLAAMQAAYQLCAHA